MENKSRPKIKETITLRGIRKVIALRMRESLDTAAQAIHMIEVELSKVNELKKRIREDGGNVTVNDILIKVVALALQRVPYLNSALVDNKIELYEDINICCAVAVKNGIVAPVIRNADQLSLWEINEKVKDLALRAKEGSLLPDELCNGTFTVSNLGMYGLDQFIAIINPPQAGILAIGAMKNRVLAGTDDRIEVKPVIKLTLTYDHRIVDGVPAAEFLMHIKDICENQLDLLL